MQDPLAQLRIVETRWSPFGRTDLVEDLGDSIEKSIFVDGAAGSPMYRFNGDIQDTTNEVISVLSYYPGYFPLLFLREEERDNALVIGAGGGRDVLLMLMAGVDSITAVEINGDAVALMQEYSDFNGGLYKHFPGVRVVVEEGRNFLRRSRDQYDIIMLSLPVSKTSSSYENFALSENTLFTTESILDYYDHLTPEGRLVVVTHHMPEIYKLLFTSIKALEQRGIETQQAMKHLYTTGPMILPIFVLKKSEFTPEESKVIHQAVHAFYTNETMYISHVEQVTLRPLADVGISAEWSMMNRIMVALAEGQIDLGEVVKKTSLDLRPPTDDRPFFYKLDIGLPWPLPLLLWLSLGAFGILLYLPFQSHKRYFSNDLLSDEKRLQPMPVRYLMLFALLGIGFIMIELALFHRFSLFLGKPTVTLSILLFSLLIGAGLGSLTSGPLVRKSGRRALIGAAFIVTVIIFVYLMLLPSIFERALGLGLTMRLIISTALLLLLGFFMGFPFPTGIRLLKENGFGNLIPWMWGINGAASVLGAVLTIILALEFGYSWALVLGAGSYLIIAIVFSVNK